MEAELETTPHGAQGVPRSEEDPQGGGGWGSRGHPGPGGQGEGVDNTVEAMGGHQRV